MPPLTVVQTTTDVVTLVHLYRVTRGKLAFLLGTIRTKRTRSPIRYVVYSISCSYHDALFAYSIVYCVTTQDNAPPVKSAEDDSDLPASSSDSDLPTSSSNGNNNYNGQVLSCGRCGDRATLIAAVEHYGTVVFREGGREWIIRRDDVAMMHAFRFGNDAAIRELLAVARRAYVRAYDNYYRNNAHEDLVAGDYDANLGYDEWYHQMMNANLAEGLAAS